MHHHRQAPALKHLTDPKNASEPLLSSFLLLEFLARWCFYLSFRQLLIQQWEHQWRLKGCTGLLTQEHKRVWNSEQSEFSSAFSKPFFWFCIAARAVWHWEKMRDGNQFKCSAHHKANIYIYIFFFIIFTSFTNPFTPGFSVWMALSCAAQTDSTDLRGDQEDHSSPISSFTLTLKDSRHLVQRNCF